MKKIGKVGEISWIVGNILCALGTCLASKSGFGVASIVTPAFALNRKIASLNAIFTVGVCEYIIQGLLLALCCVLIGKFKVKFVATICNILFYGACFDILNSLLAPLVPNGIFERILFATLGTIITGFAVALMLRTYIPPAAYEIFVKEVADAKGIEVSRLKLIFDCSLLILGILMMIVFFGKFLFDIVGPLTVISAVANSILITFFGKILDKIFDFTPAIPKLYKILNSENT